MNAPTTPPTNLAVYMRVSSDEQREQGSIQTQRAPADRWLAVQNIIPYAWYADDGVSGTIPFASRPEGRRLLADATAGHIDTVLCYRLDRLGRNALAVLEAVRDLDKLGVRLVSITESFDTSTPAGQLQLNMLASIAQFERDSIVQRSTEGTARLLREGRWPGGVRPYGYAVEGKQNTAHLVVDEVQADVVRRIFRRVVDLGEPTSQVAHWLNAQGIPAPGGGTWSHSRVYDLLVNTVYIGRATYGKQGNKRAHQDASNPHLTIIPVPPIVDEPTFYAARAGLRNRQHWQQRAATRTYLLAGLMTCGECGHLYSGEWMPRPGHPEHPGYRTYRCAYRRRPEVKGPARCTGASVSADWVEQQVLADVLGWVADPGAALTLLAARLAGNADQANALRDDLARTQRDLDAQQTERDAVARLFRKGTLSERDLERQLADITQEQDALLATQRRLEAQARASQEAADRVANAGVLLTYLHERQASGTLDLRAAVEGLVDSIVVYTEPDGLSTRGKPKTQPVVRVRYAFEAPDSTTGNAQPMPWGSHPPSCCSLRSTPCKHPSPQRNGRTYCWPGCESGSTCS